MRTAKDERNPDLHSNHASIDFSKLHSILVMDFVAFSGIFALEGQVQRTNIIFCPISIRFEAFRPELDGVNGSRQPISRPACLSLLGLLAHPVYPHKGCFRCWPKSSHRLALC